MLHLIQSNQMEVLSEQLAKMLTTSPEHSSLVNLLASEQILVQSPGMSTWLRLEIAKHNGIAAGLEFPLPSSFIWQLCHNLLPDVPEQNAFTKAAMTWKLMDLLPSLLGDAEFVVLKQYLDEHTPDNKNVGSQQTITSQYDIKLYQLCARIADIFDQYLVYRPDWILAWENGEESECSASKLEEHQRWQPKLWQALVHYNKHTLNASHYHRANLHQSLLSALLNDENIHPSLPKRLFVFGISSMAPQTLEVLHALAKTTEVVMLALSPCQHYWGDIIDPKLRARLAVQYADKKQLAEGWEELLEVGNPLLANNGKMGRELLDLILSLPPEHTKFDYDCYIEPDKAPHELNLLEGVQYDILQMETLGESLGPTPDIYQNILKRRPLAKQDDSITLRSCHSPLREVETLHDHLVGLLSKYPDLHPKDIVVMMPDVASYAPYIDAVFGTANSEFYQSRFDDEPLNSTLAIPYGIADRGAAQESPLINSFISLLNINQSRFSLSEVLSILEVPAILRKFKLDNDEYEQIKRWLNEANVRWGRDGKSRSELGLPPFEQNSWAFGIKRLILGYTLSPEQSLYSGSLSVASVEGQIAQALGKFLDFIEAIDNLTEQLHQECDTQTRLHQINELLDAFYEADDNELSQLLTLRESLTHLSDELDAVDMRPQVSLEVMRQWFIQRLNESGVGQRYLAGSVNFCTLMPMRSIPFKVVCLLGMNDGDFPRVQHPIGFDLMAHLGPRKGDRSRRLDERYLFIEALLSARQQLYISYIGHSERDNTERIPSMLVSELLEFCQLSYLPDAVDKTSLAITDLNLVESQVRKHMIIEQPLQPFDRTLFDSTNPYQSYHQRWCPPVGSVNTKTAFFDKSSPLNINLLDEVLSSLDGQTPELDLSALIRFYRNPAQFFFNRSLKVYLDLDIQSDENDEPFVLDGLNKYQLRSSLIADKLSQYEQSLNEMSDKQPHQSHSLIDTLKAQGHLPLPPFDDIILNQHQRDVAPIVDRLLFLNQEQRTRSVNINIELPISSAPSLTHLCIVGRIDDISPKGLINYKPSTASGKDLVQCYIRHLCLQAQGQQQYSYLLDLANFHAFAPLTIEQATHQLSQFVDLFLHGQSQPLCLPPSTAWAYINTEVDSEENSHQQRLKGAQKELEKNEFSEGNDTYFKRLFSFPQDFSEHTFAAHVDSLFKPMLTNYCSGKLSELDEFDGLTYLSPSKIDGASPAASPLQTK